MLRRVGDYLAYLVVRVLICAIQACSVETGAAGARWVAWVCSDWIRLRRAVIDDNLRHAFPEWTADQRDDLCRRMWQHLFLMVVEMAHAPRKIHDTNWRDYCELVKPDLMMRTLFDERPTILLTGHYGNFELSSYVLGLLGFHVYGLARPLDNVYLDRYVTRFRGLTGQHVMAKDGSAGIIDSLMAQGGKLGFLVDTHAGPKGCYVQFFGRPASTHKAIAVFAQGYRAPMLVGLGRRLDKPLHIAVGSHAVLDPVGLPPAEATVPAMTQWFTTCLEEIVRVAPEQYWWVHRRWKDTREPRRKKRQATEYRGPDEEAAAA